MKKIILALGIMFLSTTMAFAVIGPIPIDESNVPAIPNGNYYGSVTVTQTTPDCVQITVDANQTILVPLPNFGIQAFGFNYAGDPSCLQVTFPAGWEDKSNTNMDGFGKYVEEVDTTGSYRQDPLVLTVCSTCGSLAESDVIVKNANGYTFSMHVADFTYDSVPNTTSAFFATQKTTEIELSSFTAKPSNSRVTLAWVTESEIDNAGFNIWRAETENGEYVKLNDEIIPAQGSAIKGANYVFTDNIAKNRKTYFYKLQDIDVYGKSTFHGPVSATPRLLLGIFNK